MENNINNKTGWECPNCKKVYAPWMPSCTSCQTKILSSITSGNSWIGGISSVAQPFPEEYVVRGQSQPREYHSDLSNQLLNETTPEELNKIDSEMEEIVCGCFFKGTLEEFEAKIKETHGDNQYAQNYLKWIEKVKIYRQSTTINK